MLCFHQIICKDITLITILACSSLIFSLSPAPATPYHLRNGFYFLVRLKQIANEQ